MFIERLAAAVYLTAAVILFFLGFATFRHGPQRLLNRVAAWMMFFAALGAITGGFGLILRPGLETSAGLALRLAVVWELFFPTLLHFSLLYPREHPLAQRHRLAVYWLYFPYVFHVLLLGSLGHPGDLRFGTGGLEWAQGLLVPLRILFLLGVQAAEGFLRFHTSSFAVVNLFYSCLALGLLGSGYASLADPQLRRQGNLVLLSLMISVGAYALAFLIPRIAPIEVPLWFAHGFLLAALLLGATALGWAIIRHQFLDVRVLVRRGLVLSAASGLVVGFYLLAYSQVQRFATSSVAGLSPVLEVFFLLIAVFLFQPVVQLLEAGAERLFARELIDARTIFQRLSEDVVTTLEPQVLAQRLRDRLAGELALGKIGLLVDVGGKLTPAEELDKAASADASRPASEPLRDLTAPVTASDLLGLPGLNPTFLQRLGVTGQTLLVPIRHRREFLGVLAVDSGSGRPPSAEEMSLLHLLAGQLGIALENARLHRERLRRRRVEEELALAREIQRELLPSTNPVSPFFEIATLNLPSREVGGDIYDFLPFSDKRIGVALGDVSGKGIPAALLMANLHAAYRVLARTEWDPAKVVARLNQHLVSSTALDRYATFLCGCLDLENREFRYCNAGHNFPLFRNRDGRVTVLDRSDLVLGVRSEATYSEMSVHLPPGSCLVLYTDGVTEAFSPTGEEYGEERLLNLVAEWGWDSATSLRDRILKAIQEFAAGYADTDDITLVIVKVR